MKGLPRAGGEKETETKGDDEQLKDKKETKMDIGDTQETQQSGMEVDSGTTVASGIGEKRDEHSVELSRGSSSKARRVQTVSSTTISPVEKVATKKGQQVIVDANEDEEMRLTEPLFGHQLLKDWPADKLQEGMQKEMESMRSFGVYEETTADQLTAEELKSVIKTRWVLLWKGEDVKARLVAKGYTQDVTDIDTYASTPLLCSFKILLLIALSRKWRVLFGDVSTAFLHAKLSDHERIWVEPPTEYYPKDYSGTRVLWRLRCALYGLKSAPKQWQEHFAEVLRVLGGIRLKSDSNVYYFPGTGNYLMAYVDDLVLMGPEPLSLFQSVAKKVPKGARSI